MASCCSVTKGLSFMGVMWTRASATSWGRPSLRVLVRSASTARRWTTFWLKSVVVRPGVSSFSKPSLSPVSRPWPAMFRRSSPTRFSGTSTVRWSELRS